MKILFSDIYLDVLSMALKILKDFVSFLLGTFFIGLVDIVGCVMVSGYVLKIIFKNKFLEILFFVCDRIVCVRLIVLLRIIIKVKYIVENSC